MSKLELRWAKRPGESGLVTNFWVGSKGSEFHERVYLDFVVDDRSLGDLLGVGTTLDLAGCIGWQTDSLPWGEEEEQKLLEQLLLDQPTELETGRVRLYVCPECGFDVGYGAITAILEEADGTAVWRDFGFEMDPPAGDEAQPHETEGFERIGPFRFDKGQYRDAILNPPPLHDQRSAASSKIRADMNKWIVADPDHLGGAPRIRDTRISVALLLQLLAAGMTIPEIVAEYPSLSEEAIRGTLHELAESDLLAVR